jgi:hypothetical protein
MEASIQAVSPELIWELRTTEGSVVEAGGGEGAAVVGTETAGAGGQSSAGPVLVGFASELDVPAADMDVPLSLGAWL